MAGLDVRMIGRGSTLSVVVDVVAAAMVLMVFWRPTETTTADARVAIVGVILAVVVAVGMIIRWRFPRLAASTALAATTVAWLLGVSNDPMLGTAWCLYPVALRHGLRPRWASLVAILVLGMVVLTAALDQQVVLAAVAIGAAWLLGQVEARRLSAMREVVRQQAATDRARQQTAMAREVHDVVGHALSVISAEADVARRLPDQGESELRESLADIEQRSRGALAEVQAFVRTLRAEPSDVSTSRSPGGADPLRTPVSPFAVGQATLARPVLLTEALDDVINGAQASGLDVTARISVPDTAQESGLIILPIVREAVSNVIRHAGARTCEVAVWHEGDALHARIDDDGRGLTAQMSPGTGLVGMRERVEQLGGELVVTNRLAGGTSVTATIPMEWFR
ncbi:MAG: histidine kinase [Propionibacteriales bacterium]|nr:histidine kinase [Propionibacteriales bacterium]